MRYFDTHAHLNSAEFSDCLPQVLTRAQHVGVNAMLVVGTTAANSRIAVQLAQQHPMLYAAVGLQPNHLFEADPNDWDTIVQLASESRVVAIGETGLDRYWHDTPFPQQQASFDRHIQLSQTTGLPFIVHMRDCGDDLIPMLRAAAERAPLHGVMHSFTGDAALAHFCLELGLYISFAGMVTYKKSEALRDVARLIPADRILVETDCPYLSPHPERNVRPNEPALLRHTVACLAEVRGVSIAQLAEQTWQNASRLFRCEAWLSR